MCVCSAILYAVDKGLQVKLSYSHLSLQQLCPAQVFDIP